MTLREVMMESQLYPYSRERYEIKKECAELELMDAYIEQQEFMESFDNSNINIDFSLYFNEAAAPNNLLGVKNERNSKAAALFRRIINGIKKVFNRVIKFFKSIGNKMAGQIDKLRTVGTISADDAKKIKPELSKCFFPKNAEEKYSGWRIKPSNAIGKIKVDGDEKILTDNELRILYSLMKSNKVAIEVMGDDFKDGLFDYDSMDSLNAMFDADDLDKIATIGKKLSKKKRGAIYYIPLDNREISNSISKLESIIQVLDKFLGPAINNFSDIDINSDTLKTITYVNEHIHSKLAATISVYNDIQRIVGNIASTINITSTKKKGKGAKENEDEEVVTGKVSVISSKDLAAQERAEAAKKVKV